MNTDHFLLKLKNRVLLVILMLLVVPSLLIGTCFGLPDLYGDTYYAQLLPMTEKLEHAEGHRLILVGGSNIAFGTDVSLLEDILAEHGYSYTVCPYGYYAAIGSAAMLSMSGHFLREGDIVILAIEPASEALSDYFGATAFLKASEEAPYLANYLDGSQKSALLGNFVSFLQEKVRIVTSDSPITPEGVYQRSSFGENGNLDAVRSANTMPLGFDLSQPIDLQTVSIDPLFAERIRGYAKTAQKKGVAVYCSFSPMNRSAMEDASTETLYAFYDLFRESFSVPVISDPTRYVLDSKWFYDSNFHLNTAGSSLRSIYLAQDLLLQLGCTDKVDVTDYSELLSLEKDTDTSKDSIVSEDMIDLNPDDNISSNKESAYTSTETDASFYVFTEIGDGAGYEMTCLSEIGLLQDTLSLPAYYQGKPVVSFRGDAFDASSALTTLYLPETITSIPDHAFAGCTSLRYLVLTHTNAPCSVSAESFADTPSLRIFVPEEAYSLYRDGYGCEENLWTKWLDQIYTY